MSVFSNSRDDLRKSYAEAWAKRRAAMPLSPLEALISDVIALHPEYQPIMQSVENAVAFEPQSGDIHNPFLHMGLHIAVREQVSIDRPPGVRDLHQALTKSAGDVHSAEHILMDALSETLWEAQRAQRQPDEREYLAKARARLKR